MSAYDKSVVVESAKAFAQSELMGDGAVRSTTEQMGEAPTFAHWEVVRLDWIPAYQSAKKCNVDAANAGWGRLAKRINEAFGLDKPKAEGAASTKADKREAAKAESVKLIEKAGITADSTAEQILAKAGKAVGAQQAALVQAAVVKSKADAKAESVAFTALKDETAKAVKLADAAMIGKIRKLLGLK
jgi:hypothetical protein